MLRAAQKRFFYVRLPMRIGGRAVLYAIPKRRKENDMYILALESSCDETAVAVVENGRKVLCDCIASQADMHAIYGGVVPEIASRKHVEAIVSLADRETRSHISMARIHRAPRTKQMISRV